MSSDKSLRLPLSTRFSHISFHHQLGPPTRVLIITKMTGVTTPSMLRWNYVITMTVTNILGCTFMSKLHFRASQSWSTLSCTIPISIEILMKNFNHSIYIDSAKFALSKFTAKSIAEQASLTMYDTSKLM